MNGKRWTPSEECHLWYWAFEAGWSDDLIARVLRRTTGSVRYKREALSHYRLHDMISMGDALIGLENVLPRDF